MIKTKSSGLLLLLPTLLILVGCTPAAAPASPTAPSSSPESGPANAAPSEEANAVTELFQGFSADYDVLPTTEDIQKMSEVVISGVVEDIQAGPVFGIPDDDFGDITTMVFKIGNVSVASGELAPSNDGYFYLNIVAPFSAEREEFLETFPIGTEVVSYGVPYEGPGDIGVTNESAGRPDGQQLYLSAHPQGLAVKTHGADAARSATSEVVWPLTGAVVATELTEALPGGSAAGEPIYSE